MSLASEPLQAVHHCDGIVLHHRTEWWLVEFPDQEMNPTRALRLSGRLTPGYATTLRRQYGDDHLPATVHSLRPHLQCDTWRCTASLVRSATGEDRFDIDDHSAHAHVSGLDLPLARTMVDATLNPIPAGFASVFGVFGVLPKENVPVLAIRVSGYSCARFELLTARYMPTYRPLSPWRDLGGDAVTDSGSEILGWTTASDWIKPSHR
ncbi:MAG: hypothetical protein QM605_07980 [Sphingobium sp.]